MMDMNLLIVWATRVVNTGMGGTHSLESARRNRQPHALRRIF